MMNSMCRAANLRALLQNEKIKSQAEELIETFKEIEVENTRGTLVADIVDPEVEKSRHVYAKSRLLDDLNYGRLITYLNRHYRHRGIHYSADRFHGIWVSREGHQMKKIFIKGVAYAASDILRRDSHIIFQRVRSVVKYPGQITNIFSHVHHAPDGTAVTKLYLLVMSFRILSPSEEHLDPYRAFGFAAGYICHEETEPTELLEASAVVSHCARTRVQIPGAGSFMHILPLDQVSLMYQS